MLPDGTRVTPDQTGGFSRPDATGGFLAPTITHLVWSLGMLFLLPGALDLGGRLFG